MYTCWSLIYLYMRCVFPSLASFPSDINILPRPNLDCTQPDSVQTLSP